MQRFITVDGLYENDVERRRIRMRAGGRVGAWRSYAAMGPVRIGSPVRITWEPEDAGRVGQNPSSRTRTVLSVI